MSLIILNVDEVRRTLSASGGAFVVHDKEVDIVRFAINSGFADIVLDGQVALRVMYQRPGESQVRAQTLTYHDTDGLRNYYDWQLLPADLTEKGTLTVALCILRTDSEVEEWHTTPCQVRVLDTIHTDDSDEGDETITPTVAQRVAVLETMIQRVASGAPIVVSSTSAMTDTSQIYVLSTDGMWYYHNGTAWVAGGEYGAVATDTTLTQSGKPADAKAVGDEISAIKADLDDNVNDLKSELTVSNASVFENVRTNYPAVSYIHGASINVAGEIIADAGEIAFFSCVKGLTYKWNSLVRNRSYVAFYNVTPETGSTSYNDSRQDISANTAFTAPITGICAVYYHAVTQTGEMKFWAVSDFEAGVDNLSFKLQRTISRNLVGEESGVYYPVNIPAGVFNVNVSTSDGSNFSRTLNLGLYDVQKNLVDVKIVLGTTLSYRDVQKNTSTDVKYIMVEGANAVPIMVTVSYNAVGGAVAYEPYFYDAKALTKELHGIKYPDVPDYYETHIEAKANSINSLDNVEIQIGFITDEHYPMNAKNSPALMRYLWNNVPMNFIVNNGDVLVQAELKSIALREITRFNAQYDFVQNHYYPVIGNHEHNNANGSSTSTQLSLSQVQLAVLSQKNNVQFSKFASYYVDDSLTECRYYFVGCKQNSGIYDEDLVWLLQSFKTIPDGYCVVIFSHIGLKYNSSYEVTGVQTGISVLSMALLAVANKSSYTYDHVVYNYSNVDAVPIAIFSGHVHFDGYYQYSHQNYSGYIYTIATTCDAYGTQPIGSVDRTAHTVNEQAFDIISIDTTNRLIMMTRIGGGTDRTFTYSDYQAE